MSLRIKIISLFMISLLLTSWIAFLIIQHNLKQNYREIEHKEAISQLNHLVRNIDDDLVQLNQMNADWAVWDEMFLYTQKPTNQFTDSQVNPASLGTIGVTFAFIQDRNDRTMFFETSYNVRTRQDSLTIFSKVLQDVKWVSIRLLPSFQNCGIDTTELGAVYVCWQEIHMTNGAGDGGTLIFGKLIDNAVLDRLTSNTGIRFTLQPISPSEAKVPGKSIPLFDADSIQFGDEQSNQLSAKLFNIMGQHVFEIKLNYSNEISRQGDTIKSAIMQTIVAVILVNAAILLAGFHFILIRRLRRMVKELNSVQKSNNWTGFITTYNDSDELHEIGQAINQMFVLIRDQTSNLEQVANTDSLTHIGNRRAFTDRLKMELARSTRDESDLALLIIDVDCFKQYNDYYGHLAGDEVLKQLGKSLTEIACRPTDFVARIGGEEFAVILQSTSRGGAIHIAKALIDTMAHLRLAHVKSSVSDFVTISIGVTVFEGEDLLALMKRADDALYMAKKTGRNRFVVLPEADSTEPH